MTIKRPLWAETSDLMRDYYDTKWGLPEHDDRELFKMLTLELFQSGLSWSTIWKREKAFNKAFANFDAAKVAQFNQQDFERLMADSSIIRNRRKIMATINNAKVIQELLSNGETLNNYVWSFVNFKPQRLVLDGKRLSSQTSESKKMARKMKKDGFQFVGPVTVYSFMTAIGMVNAREE
ncbi:MAG: DNA-3-methyladenine glycosylase I [Limosilactobacillus sp.]|jgi:DNA-3-methyladenine glycosylase I|uniref:DNA-3-methyladenine glycosylase I n=1 Tax=Limosilactobacillus sp. TaxID=2773925 RepID=UPI0025BCCAE6|nr:DNA-3-methyladenine glycosylase I [Limosilactobacillus sp.]MCI1975235.1 DNA-3-methyladenine glycosylase I [Limosilactobacillus sp.]MCI2031309.1 DNA-3-methyladenine glycosylase I [Limosilactobacillus sp.]